MSQTLYHVSVEHTDTLTGAPDIVEVQTYADDEDQALTFAKTKVRWPEEEFYDDDDVEIREA